MQNIPVDAGPIIAWLNRKDSHRARVKPFLDRWSGNLLTTWPVVTEACAVLPVHLRIPLMRWVERGGVQIFELPGNAAGQLGELMSKHQDHLRQGFPQPATGPAEVNFSGPFLN